MKLALIIIMAFQKNKIRRDTGKEIVTVEVSEDILL
jgi:hypothetical protein